MGGQGKLSLCRYSGRLFVMSQWKLRRQVCVCVGGGAGGLRVETIRRYSNLSETIIVNYTIQL